MRQIATPERIHGFMRKLGAGAHAEAKVYFVGGVTAVLIGWRKTTIDLDLKIVPENDELLRATQQLKESLQLNVEFASPDHFIPVLPGWEERSLFVAREGKLSFYHYDPYAQALAKIERGHQQDLADVKEMFQRGLVEPAKLLDFYTQIEPRLYRYPAIDAGTFRRAVEQAVRSWEPGAS